MSSTIEQPIDSELGNGPSTESSTWVSHVVIDGELCPVSQLQQRHGITLDQWERRREVNRQRTFRVIGGQTLSLEEFEAMHPDIQLSDT